jgi:hypothetical protein
MLAFAAERIMEAEVEARRRPRVPAPLCGRFSATDIATGNLSEGRRPYTTPPGTIERTCQGSSLMRHMRPPSRANKDPGSGARLLDTARLPSLIQLTYGRR